jgi:hypothetical protein
MSKMEDPPDHSTPADQESRELDKGFLLIIGILGTLAALGFLGAVGNGLAEGQSVSQRLSKFAIAAIWGILLLASVIAARAGDFERFKAMGVWGFFARLAEAIAVGLHSAGKTIAALGAAAVVLVILVTVSAPEADPGLRVLAGFAAAATLGGFWVQRYTGSREITVRGRIDKLNRDLKGAGKQAESAREQLGRANEALGEIDRELARKFSMLTSQHLENERWTTERRADPERIKAYRQAEARERRQSTLLQIGLTILGFILGYVTSWTSDDVLNWVRHLVQAMP